MSAQLDGPATPSFSLEEKEGIFLAFGVDALQ